LSPRYLSALRASLLNKGENDIEENYRMETKIKKNQYHKAFTLVEVIMALFILTTGLLGIMRLAALNLSTSMDSRDEIIAATLAQEGLELVYNVKDNNSANYATTLNDFKYFSTSNNCKIDRLYVYGNTIDCTGGSYQLNYIAGTGFVHTGGLSGTKFFRRITITDSGTNKIITAYTSWNNAPPAVAAPGANCKTTCNISATSKCACAQMTLAITD